MVGRIILFALIAGLVWLNYTVPGEEDHKAFLLSQIQQGGSVSESMQSSIWSKVDYTNFFVASFMKTTEKSVMISYGFMKKVKLANDEWVAETRAEISQRSTY